MCILDNEVLILSVLQYKYSITWYDAWLPYKYHVIIPRVHNIIKSVSNSWYTLYKHTASRNICNSMYISVKISTFHRSDTPLIIINRAIEPLHGSARLMVKYAWKIGMTHEVETCFDLSFIDVIWMQCSFQSCSRNDIDVFSATHWSLSNTFLCSSFSRLYLFIIFFKIFFVLFDL